MEEFKDFISQFGEIEEITIVADKLSKKYRGFGFITFKVEESSRKLLDNKEGN